MATPRLKVGLVGCGGISQLHFEGWRQLNPDCAVVAICDIAPAPLKRRGDQFEIPESKRYSTHKQMLASEKLDVVDVCVPNMVHAPISIDALAAGCNVLCEKPLAPTPLLVEKMIAAKNKAKKILMTAQHQRFENKSLELKKFIDTGVLGEVYYARAHFMRRRNLPGWGSGLSFIDKSRSGGGPTVDIGVHVLDLALHFMNHPEPVTVSGITPCKLGKRKDIRGWWGEWDRDKMDVEDFAAGFVRFSNGAALSLETSWLANIREGEYQKITLLGDQAGAEWPQMTVFGETAGNLTDTQLSFPDDKMDGHHREIHVFADAVLNNKPSPVPPEQSLNVMRILDGFYRSHASGKEVRV